MVSCCCNKGSRTALQNFTTNISYNFENGSSIEARSRWKIVTYTPPGYYDPVFEYLLDSYQIAQVFHEMMWNGQVVLYAWTLVLQECIRSESWERKGRYLKSLHENKCGVLIKTSWGEMHQEEWSWRCKEFTFVCPLRVHRHWCMLGK